MLKPLRNGVLIRPTAAQAEHKIGIITLNQTNNEGRVVGVGPEVKELKVGDIVRYDEKSVAKVEGLLLCREADIYCVVE